MKINNLTPYFGSISTGVQLSLPGSGQLLKLANHKKIKNWGGKKDNYTLAIIAAPESPNFSQWVLQNTKTTSVAYWSVLKKTLPEQTLETFTKTISQLINIVSLADTLTSHKDGNNKKSPLPFGTFYMDDGSPVLITNTLHALAQENLPKETNSPNYIYTVTSSK